MEVSNLSDERANTVVAVEKNPGLQMFTASECLQKYFLLHFLRNLFSQGPRFTHITCTGSICNHSLKCGCHFSTLDINAHFRILFIAKFEFLKLHSKVRSFERMFEFNQVRLGPSI